MATDADPQREHFLHGPLGPTVLLFGTPLALAMVLQVLFNLVDQYLIARLPSAVRDASLDALGICDMVAALATILSYGYSSATATLIAQARGRGDDDEVARLAWGSLGAVTVFGLTLGGLGALFADPIVGGVLGAKGAVRVSSTSVSGKLITLTYVEPGIWFGDVSIFDGDRRTHDPYAHGETTTLNVAKADFKKILSAHVELYDAMLRLHARRIRQLFGLVEDLNTLPLRARLAKQLNHLLRSYGVPSLSDAKAIRISLQLAQEELAQLLGASRQRVNQELKQMEREHVIKIEPGGLTVLDREALLKIVNSDN
jgi:CRP-like cAMP-binding protein